jgi:DNA-binding transcriptional MocR family regulator
MVSPTYYLACRIFDDAGFAGKLIGVPEDDEGVNLDFLECQLQESESRAEKERNLLPVCLH